MKNIFRTILLLLCSVTTISQSIPVIALSSQSGGILSDTPISVNMYEPGVLSPQQVFNDGEAAMQFYATTDFDYIELYNANYYPGENCTATLKLFKWQTDYATTVATKPLAQKTFKYSNANVWNRLSFNPLPEGEYLWVLCEPEMYNVFVYKSKNTYPNIRCYAGGIERPVTFAGKIHYMKTPNVKFGTISDTGTASGEVTAPTEPNDYSTLLDVNSDTWAATDGLGRTLPLYEEAGKTKEDHFVGIYYHVWHYANAFKKPVITTQLLAQNPEAATDPTNKTWENAYTTNYYWDEPLYGYYSSQDSYVLRKHAELLAAAGVDMILIDCSNLNEVWKPGYTALFKEWEKARAQGVKVPKIAFQLSFYNHNDIIDQLKQLYTDIYRPGKYKDLWFYWKGKPLVLAFNQVYPLQFDTNDKLQNEISNFFTFRHQDPYIYRGTHNPCDPYADTSSYYTGKDFWGMMNLYPQQEYNKKANKIEQMCVSVAEPWSVKGGCGPFTNSETFSRSYSGKLRDWDRSPNAVKYGINFQEQWDYAISKDPEFIFIMNWNEWTSGADLSHGKGNAVTFFDEYSSEGSRDIEPTKGILQDYYYYQMVANIRRYKGVSEPVEVKANNTIDIQGNISQWQNIQPEFKSWEGSDPERDCLGGGNVQYTNNTGRNDIISSKVAYDDNNIYFMVETAKDLSPDSDPGWMRLFIDTIPDGNSNWEGYEYVINRINPSNGKAILEVSAGGWNFSEVAKVDYTVQGNVLQISVPKKALGITDTAININFKWSDNMQKDGDIMDFYSNGEVAPLGRFMYHFATKDSTESTKTVPNKLPGWIMPAASAAGAVAVIIAALFLIKKRKKSKTKDTQPAK